MLNRNLGALPMIGGNAATLNGDYLNSIKAIADDIDLARDYVHTSTSSWSTTTPPSPSSTRSGGRASAG